MSRCLNASMLIVCASMFAGAITDAQQLAPTDASVTFEARGDFQYRFYKSRVPIELDTTCFVVCTDPANPEAIEDITAGTGAVATDDWYLRNWTVVEMPQGTGGRALAIAVITAQSNSDSAFISPVFKDDYDRPLVFGNEIFVGFKPDVTDEEARALIASTGAGDVIEANYGGMNHVYCLRAAQRNGFMVLQAANLLASRAQVRFAEPLMMMSGEPNGDPVIPDDELFSDVWALDNNGQNGGTAGIDINGPEAWATTTGDPGITVAIIDTGIQLDHPDLAPNIIQGADFTDDANHGAMGEAVNFCDVHGTLVAGALAAVQNNGIGVAGIAPNTSVMSIRAFMTIVSLCDGRWFSETSWTVDALAHAELSGVDITVNSNSYGNRSSLIAEKYLATRANGMVHFAAAGNRPGTRIAFPAVLPGVIACTGIDRNGAIWFDEVRNIGATTGCVIDIAAPAADILTTDLTAPGDGFNPEDDYAYASGTSFSAPYSAGIAALVLAEAPWLEPAQVEAVIKFSATDMGDPGFDTRYGWGLVDAMGAIEFMNGCNGFDTAPRSPEEDCDANGVRDACEIYFDADQDADGNGVLDVCDEPAGCPCDINNDDLITILDLLGYLELWLVADPAAETTCDTGAGNIDIQDLLVFVECWLESSNGRPCPEGGEPVVPDIAG